MAPMLLEGVSVLLKRVNLFDSIVLFDNLNEFESTAIGIRNTCFFIDENILIKNQINILEKIAVPASNNSIALLSSGLKGNSIQSYFEAGLTALILKTATYEEFRQCSESLLKRKVYMCGGLMSEYLNFCFRQDQHIPLTNQETDFLRLITSGASMQKIGERLDLSASLVFYYKKKINAKASY